MKTQKASGNSVGALLRQACNAGCHELVKHLTVQSSEITFDLALESFLEHCKGFTAADFTSPVTERTGSSKGDETEKNGPYNGDGKTLTPDEIKALTFYLMVKPLRVRDHVNQLIARNDSDVISKIAPLLSLIVTALSKLDLEPYPHSACLTFECGKLTEGGDYPKDGLQISLPVPLVLGEPTCITDSSPHIVIDSYNNEIGSHGNIVIDSNNEIFISEKKTLHYSVELIGVKAARVAKWAPASISGDRDEWIVPPATWFVNVDCTEAHKSKEIEFSLVWGDVMCRGDQTTKELDDTTVTEYCPAETTTSKLGKELLVTASPPDLAQALSGTTGSFSKSLVPKALTIKSCGEFDCLDLTFLVLKKRVDTDPNKCLSHFGTKPGETFKHPDGRIATVVGVAPYQGMLTLWFQVAGESSLIRFEDGTDLKGTEYDTSVKGRLFTFDVNHEVSHEQHFPFCIRSSHSPEIQLLDTSIEVCMGQFGIPALQRCIIKGVVVTAVGAARVKDRLRMFFVADGSNEAVSYPSRTAIDVLETTSPGLDAAPHQTSKVTRLIAVKASSTANSILSCDTRCLDSQRQEILLDVQHCEELFGVASGQRVIADCQRGTVVGVQGATNGPVLWFHRDGAAGAEALAPGTPLLLLNEAQVVSGNSKASAAASKAVKTVTVAEYDRDANEFCFDYPYKCGTMHSRLELFDRRSEDCNALFGVVPGQRVRDSLVGIGATAIGMRVKPDGKLAMWYHVDGSAGAGIYEEGTVLTVIPGDVRQLPATHVAANASQSFVTSKKVALPAEPLQLTFRYPAGVEQSRDLPFDIRRDVCLQHFGVEPGRRVRVHGDLATAIGMREDEGKLTMWYHDDEKDGAGLYTPGLMIELTAVVVPMDRLAVLAEVPAEMIDLNLSERAPVTGGGSELFDVRPEPCVKFFRLCPGQRVRVLKTQQEATVVGMRNAAGRVQLWLSDATGARSYSAGTAIEVLDGELAPTGQSDHQLVVNHLPFDPSMELRRTFNYQTGARALSGEAMFDVREDVCRSLFGVAPGQRVLSDVGMATAVGMKHLPDGTLAMWYHLDGAPGAGTFRAGSSLTVTGSTVKLSPFVDGGSTATIVTFDDDLPREPLQLDFQYHVGGSVTESELRKALGDNFEALCTRYFDVRPEICQRFGVLPGQRVRAQGHEATAIGAAPDGGFLKMWYHPDGRYGAGLYPTGTEVRLTNKFVSLLSPRQLDVAMSPPKPIAESQPEKEKSPLQKSTVQTNPQAPNSAATNRVTCEPAFTGEDFIVKDVAVQPLQLTVPYFRGKSKVSSMFDCRPAKCLELFGVSIGQKFVRDNGNVTTVFGMAQSGSGSVATTKLFFCEEGTNYVGAYSVGTKLTPATIIGATAPTTLVSTGSEVVSLIKNDTVEAHCHPTESVGTERHSNIPLPEATSTLPGSYAQREPEPYLSLLAHLPSRDESLIGSSTPWNDDVWARDATQVEESATTAKQSPEVLSTDDVKRTFFSGVSQPEVDVTLFAKLLRQSLVALRQLVSVPPSELRDEFTWRVRAAKGLERRVHQVRQLSTFWLSPAVQARSFLFSLPLDCATLLGQLRSHDGLAEVLDQLAQSDNALRRLANIPYCRFFQTIAVCCIALLLRGASSGSAHVAVRVVVLLATAGECDELRRFMQATVKQLHASDKYEIVLTISPRHGDNDEHSDTNTIWIETTSNCSGARDIKITFRGESQSGQGSELDIAAEVMASRVPPREDAVSLPLKRSLNSSTSKEMRVSALLDAILHTFSVLSNSLSDDEYLFGACIPALLVFVPNKRTAQLVVDALVKYEVWVASGEQLPECFYLDACCDGVKGVPEEELLLLPRKGLSIVFTHWVPPSFAHCSAVSMAATATEQQLSPSTTATFEVLSAIDFGCYAEATWNDATGLPEVTELGVTHEMQLQRLMCIPGSNTNALFCSLSSSRRLSYTQQHEAHIGTLLYLRERFSIGFEYSKRLLHALRICKLHLSDAGQLWGAVTFASSMAQCATLLSGDVECSLTDVVRTWQQAQAVTCANTGAPHPLPAVRIAEEFARVLDIEKVPYDGSAGDVNQMIEGFQMLGLVFSCRPRPVKREVDGGIKLYFLGHAKVESGVTTVVCPPLDVGDARTTLTFWMTAPAPQGGAMVIGAFPHADHRELDRARTGFEEQAADDAAHIDDDEFLPPTVVEVPSLFFIVWPVQEIEATLRKLVSVGCFTVQCEVADAVIVILTETAEVASAVAAKIEKDMMEPVRRRAVSSVLEVHLEGGCRVVASSSANAISDVLHGEGESIRVALRIPGLNRSATPTFAARCLLPRTLGHRFVSVDCTDDETVIATLPRKHDALAARDELSSNGAQLHLREFSYDPHMWSSGANIGLMLQLSIQFNNYVDLARVSADAQRIAQEVCNCLPPVASPELRDCQHELIGRTLYVFANLICSRSDTPAVIASFRQCLDGLGNANADLKVRYRFVYSLSIPLPEAVDISNSFVARVVKRNVHQYYGLVECREYRTKGGVTHAQLFSENCDALSDCVARIRLALQQRKEYTLADLGLLSSRTRFERHHFIVLFRDPRFQQAFSSYPGFSERLYFDATTRCVHCYYGSNNDFVPTKSDMGDALAAVSGKLWVSVPKDMIVRRTLDNDSQDAALETVDLTCPPPSGILPGDAHEWWQEHIVLTVIGRSVRTFLGAGGGYLRCLQKGCRALVERWHPSPPGFRDDSSVCHTFCHGCGCRYCYCCSAQSNNGCLVAPHSGVCVHRAQQDQKFLSQSVQQCLTGIKKCPRDPSHTLQWPSPTDCNNVGGVFAACAKCAVRVCCACAEVLPRSRTSHICPFPQSRQQCIAEACEAYILQHFHPRTMRNLIRGEIMRVCPDAELPFEWTRTADDDTRAYEQWRSQLAMTNQRRQLNDDQRTAIQRVNLIFDSINLCPSIMPLIDAATPPANSPQSFHKSFLKLLKALRIKMASDTVKRLVEQRSALGLYTGQWIHSKLNELLHTQPTSPADRLRVQRRLNKCGPYLRKLLNELRRRPACARGEEIVVYRGVSLDDTEWDKYRRLNSTVRWRALTSCSRSLAVAEEFARSGGAAPRLVRVTVCGLCAKDASNPVEDEVIILPYTPLRIIKWSNDELELWHECDHQEGEHSEQRGADLPNPLETSQKMKQ